MGTQRATKMHTLLILLLSLRFFALDAFVISKQRDFRNKSHIVFAQRESESNVRKRRDVLNTAAATITAATAIPTQDAQARNLKSRSDGYAVQKTDSEWQSLLSATQYNILRLGGTERPYSSVLESEERPGIYKCAGCETDLFSSKEKFHSGTGWPSFARGLDGVEKEDVNFATAKLIGAELRCKTCGGHLGDVFADGYLFVGTPAFISGERYCIDGAALIFKPENGEPAVAGDKSPPPSEPSLPDWLSPPEINSRSK